MKLARYIPAGIGTGICALALTGSAVLGGTAPAGAATLAPHAATDRTGTAQTAAEAMTAWVNGPGYDYLNATEAAESARDGAALTRAANLAAAHPQPTGTDIYVATMHVYAAAGEALTRGDTATASADLAKADDMAWDIIKVTFSALDRVQLHG